MNKEQILAEIRRTAADNGGTPVGMGRFEKDTGVKETDWRGRFWVRWSDAVREAGFTPLPLNSKTDQTVLLSQLASFVRELGRFPTYAEIRMRKLQDAAFPSHGVVTRMGSRRQILEQVAAFCEDRPDFQDVAVISKRLMDNDPEASALDSSEGNLVTGYVNLALMKVGREKRLKIGKAKLVCQTYLSQQKAIHALPTEDSALLIRYFLTGGATAA